MRRETGSPKILDSSIELFQSSVSWRWLNDTWALGTRLDMQNPVISFVISKWMLPELSFSDRWSRGTKLWEREWRRPNSIDHIQKIGHSTYLRTCSFP